MKTEEIVLGEGRKQECLLMNLEVLAPLCLHDLRRTFESSKTSNFGVESVSLALATANPAILHSSGVFSTNHQNSITRRDEMASTHVPMTNSQQFPFAFRSSVFCSR